MNMVLILSYNLDTSWDLEMTPHVCVCAPQIRMEWANSVYDAKTA